MKVTPKTFRKSCLALMLPALFAVEMTTAADLRGSLSGQWREFSEEALDSRQQDSHPSLALEAEIYLPWNGGDDALLIAPFIRQDVRDEERSHADLREAYWLHQADDWLLKVGLGREFWGATESQHLVDIINQTDILENVDNEDKLGQPMVKLGWFLPRGELTFWWLPYFRERPFAGVEGRPRLALPVAEDDSRYESGAEERHQDFALRWSGVLGPVDLGLAHFRGTSREPLLQPRLNALGQPELVPFYPVINQTSLDITAALGNWLWKLEALRRQGFGDLHHAAVGGFEYTRLNFVDSGLDLGLLWEYHWDERGEEATQPFQRDHFLGVRLTFNDFQSTDLLAGVILDQGSDARVGLLEASRRLGRDWTLALEWRFFDGQEADDPLFGARQDDFVQLDLSYHF